jgi:hypothetical protein
MIEITEDHVIHAVGVYCCGIVEEGMVELNLIQIAGMTADVVAKVKVHVAIIIVQATAIFIQKA